MPECLNLVYMFMVEHIMYIKRYFKASELAIKIIYFKKVNLQKNRNQDHYITKSI